MLKVLRKRIATDYEEHHPEQSIQILGHSVVGITCRHYADRDPLVFKAITTNPQSWAFSELANGYDGQCPFRRRRFP